MLAVEQCVCLAVLEHELALHAEVHVTATCEHGTGRCTLALLHIGMPCDSTLLSLQLLQQIIWPIVSMMQMQALSSTSSTTTARGVCGRVKQAAYI